MKFLKVIIAVAAIACTASVAQAQVVKKTAATAAMPTCSG